MDGIRSKVQDPEERKKTQKKILLPSTFSIAISIIMVSVGTKYADTCFVDAPLYLMVGGGITLAMAILKIIAVKTPSECDDKLVLYLSPIMSLVSMGVMLWGSVVVFGGYSSVNQVHVHPSPRPDYPDAEARNFHDAGDMADAHDAHIHNYCPYTPFMYAFVILILQWVMYPIIFCCECMLLICTVSACCAGAAAGAATYSAAATSDPSATVTTSSA